MSLNMETSYIFAGFAGFSTILLAKTTVEYGGS